MLLTIALGLVVLWLLGVAGAYALGSFGYLFLLAAIALFIIRVVKARTSSKTKQISPLSPPVKPV